MLMVLAFSLNFFEKELEDQGKAALTVTYGSFQLALDKIYAEQQMTALSQTQRKIIGIAAKDKITAVLNYFLKLTAQDYNLDLIEVVDSQGNLLADNFQSYNDENRPVIPLQKPAEDKKTASYISLRNSTAYLITTAPIIFSNELVGFLNLGTNFNTDLANYFASILHRELLLLHDNQNLLTASDTQLNFNITHLPPLNEISVSGVFIPGSQIDHYDFDFYFFTIPSDNSFQAVIGIANSRAENHAALLRLKFFLWFLTGFCFSFGFIGANLLARNIKQSIFGMEPKEIASLLNQRTTILESTFEGIIALDQNGLITLMNQEAHRLLPSMTPKTGLPAEQFFHNLDLNELLATGRAIYNQQQVIDESIVVYNCVPIQHHQQILGAVITLRDLTEFKKVAEELMEVKSYTQALRSQSHEFMNKLQSISGLIQLGRHETALSLLHETAATHQEIISFLSKSFSTSAVSGILLGKFNRARELNIDFNIDRSSYIPKNTNIPDHELVSIVGNLIENSFEALKTSSIPNKTVVVRIRPTGKNLKVIIADNGPGILPEIKQSIFKRGVTSKKGINKGIGLSLIKQYVDNLHGKINFRSGKFTIFIVTIPFHKEAIKS